MLADHLWVQVQSFFGQQIANAFASNGAFVINALENLMADIRSQSDISIVLNRILDQLYWEELKKSGSSQAGKRIMSTKELTDLKGKSARFNRP